MTSKLDGARTILEVHNSKSTKPVDIKAFFDNLTEMGGTSEDTLMAASWEDLEMCGAPRILARQIATFFRGDQKETVQKVILEDGNLERLAKAMTPRQLISAFDPKQPKSPVAEQLKFLSEGKEFLIFNDDGTIDEETSYMLLSQMDDYGPISTYVNASGDLKTPYAVGKQPTQIANEHPLFPGVALRNGISLIGCDWDKINWQTKKILYLAITKTKEIDMSQMHELDVYNLAVSGMVSRRCIKAASLYKECEILGNLPSLSVQLGKKANKDNSNNPFNLGKNHCV